jgi:hypothetical protein
VPDTTMPFKLGWRRVPTDHRNLRLASYATPGTPAIVPASADWMSKDKSWPILGNDKIGDCVFVAMAHLVQSWSMYSAGAETLIPERRVIGAYSAVTGYDPYTGTNDNGAVSTKALSYWRRTGLDGHKIAAYLQVDHRDENEVRAAMNLFGGLFIAASMPLSAGDQFEAYKTWTPGRGARGRAGSWGGHAIHMGRYDATGLTVSTWGRAQKATWSWFDAYVDEAYAIVSPDFLTAASGMNPLGFDLTRMLADLRTIVTV